MIRARNLKYLVKRSIYWGLFYSGALRAMSVLLKKIRKRHRAIILVYHRFAEERDGGYRLPHLEAKEFWRQMKHLKKWYEVIGMDDLADLLERRESPRRPSIAITIDDGYLNNYMIAYPILKKLGLPATIYLTTGFIGSRKAPWVDDLAEVLAAAGPGELFFPEVLGQERIDISTDRGKKMAGESLFKALLPLRLEDKARLLEGLRKKIGVGKDPGDKSERKMMNWEEVEDMSANGISFGAHTVSHGTLSRIEMAEARREILESKRAVEKRLGKKVRHFAVPNGKKEDFSAELARYCRDCDFETVVTTEAGSIKAGDDRYSLKRMLPPPPIYYFACETAREFFLNK